MRSIPKPGGLLLSVVLALRALPGFAQESAGSAVYGDPSPRNWTVPVYPPDALKAGVSGKLVLEFVVDAEGRVVDPKIKENEKAPADPRLGAAVLAAAKQWTFAPALAAGKPEARAVAVAVGFYVKGRGGKPSVDLPLRPDVAPTTPAKALSQSDPAYPDELLPRKLPGEAEFEFQVSVAGRAEDIKVRYASDAAFVATGLATVKSWMFEPGRQGPLPVPTAKISPMEFFVEGEKSSDEDVLAANGISGLAANEVDKAPVPRSLYAPVYPRARLTAGETGDAEVEFVIRENGVTDLFLVTAASQPEFGESLAAAVALWRFRPAVKGLERTTVKLRVHHWFALKGTDADPDTRLAAALKAGIAGARGLDRPLVPVWRVAPRYPPTLHGEKPAGEAVIEFVIDREGRARLPAVVSATNEAFGWAAASALSQWVFEPPLRSGQPVDVRVNVPVGFEPPVE